MDKGSHAWIQTFRGEAFDYLKPDPKTINIEDIAHALGYTCRYSGHTTFFYSVAEHCVIGSKMVPPEIRIHFLLHDALEAYISDIPRPLKRLLPEYLVLEKKLEPLIYEALYMKFPSDEVMHEVKKADLKMLLTEQPQVLGPAPKAWNIVAEPYDVMLPGWQPERASMGYLDRYYELIGGRI